MNINELIKPIESHAVRNGFVCDTVLVRILEKQFREAMEGYFELLIDAINTREQTHGSFRGGPEHYYQEDIKIIEKACNAKWEDIKED